MPSDINFLTKLIATKNHVIWDWNGTLLDDVSHAVKTMNPLLVDHGLRGLDIDRYRSLFEFPVLKYYQALGFDFERESFESLCHRFVDQFMIGFKECPLIPGMHSILQKTRSAVSTQSILSATDQRSLDEMVAHFELEPLFDHVFGINNKLAHSKVERGLELIELSGVSNLETLLIGDTLHDVEVGQALNVEVVLLDHGHQEQRRLSGSAVRILNLRTTGRVRP